jgi:hypothetical protein
LPQGKKVLRLLGAKVRTGLRVRLALIQLVDGAPVGQGDLPVTIPLSLGLSGSACVGSDAGAPVMTD